MRQIRLIYILVFFFSFINTSITEDKVFIEVKVDNEAITNIDIINEKNYLIAILKSLAVHETFLQKLHEVRLLPDPAFTDNEWKFLKSTLLLFQI